VRLRSREQSRRRIRFAVATKIMSAKVPVTHRLSAPKKPINIHGQAGSLSPFGLGSDDVDRDRKAKPKRPEPGHNKFLVRTDAGGVPRATCTGSTNSTRPGCAPSSNNGLLIDDPQIGHVYLDQWHRLRDAASRFPPQLVDANSAAHPVAPPAGTSATMVWFNRTHHEVDLAELRLGRA
jgi:hypothetical protein